MTQDTQRKKKRTERQYVVELEEPRKHRLAYTLGALGGLALGILVKRGLESMGISAPEAARPETDDEAPAPARQELRATPGRMRRDPVDQDEQLLLEDAVLDAYLDDPVLGERGIDVGVISRGIVELSGSVWTRAEAAHAVAVAQGVQGVSTVVNRMEIEDERERLHPRFDSDDEEFEMSGAEWTGHQAGMGSRRQGEETDPSRRDDSHVMREDALEQADRSQFADEGHSGNPRTSDAHDGPAPNRTHFRDDELDNQSPYGQHAVPQGSQDDGPPQAFNAQARVGEGLKPGTELALEGEDLPVKPHQQPSRDNERGV
jgi:hypothetical protein